VDEPQPDAQTQPRLAIQIEEEPAPHRYAVALMHRDFRAYPIMDEELDSLASAHSSVNQVFLGVVLGALMSVAITFGTGGITESNRVTYVWIAAGLAVASAYFGICAVIDVLGARRRVDRVRRRGATGESAR
jgi:hypothetical protein